ncbi:MAG: MBL fold metallo-hydrolase [Proteobacteria bacterium]|nr:MBL fold metallo-hydrolase [Pseudomonadota bacterium]
MTSERVFASDGFTVERVVVGALDNNVFLITDSATGAALIVDAADEPDKILSMATGVDVRAVFTTHGHWDHHQAVPEVTDTLQVPFMIHVLDAPIADKDTYTRVEPGTLMIGKTEAKVVHTPGHTPGSVCLVLDGVVFTGDTLFPGGPGATRFEHSSFATIIRSIETELFTLGDATVVLPGHGGSTTIGTERPQLAEWVERGW